MIRSKFDVRPESAFIVASSPRSGSYLLCEGLEAVGAGRPTEAFCREYRDEFRRRWRLPAGVAAAEFFEAIIANGSSANGVFGVKIHASQMQGFNAEIAEAGAAGDFFRRVLEVGKFLHITRRDRRAQAISYYRALATREWWRIDGVKNHQATGAEPAFDSARIRWLEKHLEEEEEGWRDFFRQKSVAPLEIDYETLCRDYRGQIARALNFLGLQPEPASALPEPRLKRQSDGTSRLWRQWLDREDAMAKMRRPAPDGGSAPRDAWR